MKKNIFALFAGAACLISLQAHAIDYGPFSLTGFAKAEGAWVTNVCQGCQLFPDENKQRLWADILIPGKEYKTRWTHVTLFQPYLGARFDLDGGFKVNALVSQRWRDGLIDIPGFMYEKNISLSHEYYGSIHYGAMTTRGWSLADFPYGTNLNVADAWGASGAGYGILENAIRYISPRMDVLEGDLVLEASYDKGDTRFRIHKSRFVELYA